MKSIIAALVLVSSATAATAEIGPANSTNQHQRDSANFYDNVPDFSVLSGARTSDAPAGQEAVNRHGHRRVIAR